MRLHAEKKLGKILLVELSPAVPNLGRFIVMPRYGLLAIASVLAEKTDYEVRHLFEPYVGTIDADVIVRENPRYILVSGLSTTAHQNRLLLQDVRSRLGDSVTVIAGGEHATMFPEDARSYADYLLVYEGDESVISLLAALQENSPWERQALFPQIPGLHYKDRNGRWQSNDTPARVTEIDYRYDFSVVAGSRDVVSRFRTAHIPIQTSRGCKYACSFCSWIGLFGKSGYVVRPIDDVVHDVVHTIDYTGVRSFIVADNLFAGDAAYTEALMARIERAFHDRADKPLMTVLCRADQFSGTAGSLPESTIAAMARGGVANVSLGLESISSRSLIQMRKQADLEKYLAASATLKRHGINMLATFVAGFDGDTYEDVVNIAEFGERMGLFTIQVYARGITPGTVDDIMSSHRMIPGTHYKYFNGHTVSILPKQMLPSELQKAIFDAAFRFHGRKIQQRSLALRAFRHIWNGIQPHYEGLKKLEREILIPEGFYRRVVERFVLHDPTLDALVGDEVRYAEFVKRCGKIFEESDGGVRVRADVSEEFAAVPG